MDVVAMRSVSVSAVRPWDSVDASGWMYDERGGWVEDDLSPRDTQEQIDLCLKCPIADECCDCLSSTVRRRSILARVTGIRAKKSR